MNIRSETTRRGVLRTALAGASLAVAAPTILRHALGETPIKIGMPLALTGPAGEIGQQMRNGAEFWTEEVNASGGLLGREIQLYAQDTTGDPATCVRKAQEVVERDGCRLLFGMVLSSEALAVVPKLAEWNAIFMSSDNGDGRLTGSSFVPNFFRANISGPMETRVISLWLRQAKYTKFYALGMDYAWGHNSVGVFKDEIAKAKKDYIGDVFSPIGTKDFSTYITKIRQSGAEVCFLVLQGDDNNAFPTPLSDWPDRRATCSRSTIRRTRLLSLPGKNSTTRCLTCSRESNTRLARCCRPASRRRRVSILTSYDRRWRPRLSIASRGAWRCVPAIIRRCRAATS